MGSAHAEDRSARMRLARVQMEHEEEEALKKRDEYRQQMLSKAGIEDDR